MKRLNNFRELADELKRVERNLPPMFNSVLHIVGEAAAKEAKEKIIGRISPLPAVPPYNAWLPLKPATVDYKTYKGWGKYGNARSILYATGAMYDSIGYKVRKGARQVAIGTDIQYAAVQEYGGGHVPPRPFLGPAVVRTAQRLYPRMELIFWRTLCGKRAF